MPASWGDKGVPRIEAKLTVRGRRGGVGQRTPPPGGVGVLEAAGALSGDVTPKMVLLQFLGSFSRRSGLYN